MTAARVICRKGHKDCGVFTMLYLQNAGVAIGSLESILACFACNISVPCTGKKRRKSKASFAGLDLRYVGVASSAPNFAYDCSAYKTSKNFCDFVLKRQWSRRTETFIAKDMPFNQL